MSLKDKIMNIVAANPKLVTFAIGFGITFTIGTAIGMLEQGHLSWDAFAQSISQKNRQDQSSS
jgi:hypothetical protein